MAFWNPFGWSEEDRLAIRSIVRPITQVASLAGSMGVTFAGKGATDTVAGTTDAAAAAGADFDQPSTLIPEDPNAMGTMKEWTTDQGINDPARIITPEQQAATKGSFTADQTNISDPFTTDAPGGEMSVARAQHLLETTEPGTSLENLQSIGEDIEAMGGDTIDSVWNPEDTLDPERLRRQEQLEGSDQAVIDGQVLLKELDPKKTADEIRDAQFRPDVFDEGAATDAAITDKSLSGTKLQQQETTAEQLSTNAEAVSPTETPIGPENQTGSQAEADKTTPETDTRGRGGKEESKFWDLHDFSWDNLMKWLETKEGKKFFFEWGQKFTAMSGGDAPNRKKLTKKQAAAIRKKVKEKYGR